MPTKISEDSAFPFKIGDPCEIEIDTKKNQLSVRTVSQEKALKDGWSRRPRKSGS